MKAQTTTDSRQAVFCSTLKEAIEAAEKGFRPYYWNEPRPVVEIKWRFPEGHKLTKEESLDWLCDQSRENERIEKEEA